MQLDRIQIQPRLRNGWQAIDLGWVMARRWWWPLALSWALPHFALLALLLAILPGEHWWIAFSATWWLKPLWDAAPLYLISRALFGERVSLPQTWRAVLAQMRWEILPWLLWRRFSPTRSMDMPVTVLEQLRAGARSKRLAVLHLQNTGAGGWLTIVCAHLEIAIGFGLLGLLYWLLPESALPSFDDIWSGDHTGLSLVYYMAFEIGAALVAPFYVAAGFSLYINRRIELEGWDIEIRFRHLAAARRARSAVAALSFGGLLLGALLSMPFATSRAIAEDIAPTEIELRVEQKEAQARIERILAGPDFKAKDTVQGWRWKRDPETGKAESIPQWLIDVAEWLESRFDKSDSKHHRRVVGSAEILRLVLGIALVGLFAWLLYRYRDTLREWLRLPPPKTRKSTAPEVLFGLDVRAQSLPDDVITNVRKLWQQQQPREALSLLYRAALAQLLQRFALPFRDDMTEGECVLIANDGAPADTAEFFAKLTRTWQRLAYAHIAPDAATLDAHCAQWQRVFGDAC